MVLIIGKILTDNIGKIEIFSPCWDCISGICPFDIMRKQFENEEWHLELIVKKCKFYFPKNLSKFSRNELSELKGTLSSDDLERKEIIIKEFKKRDKKILNKVK